MVGNVFPESLVWSCLDPAQSLSGVLQFPQTLTKQKPTSRWTGDSTLAVGVISLSGGVSGGCWSVSHQCTPVSVCKAPMLNPPPAHNSL